MMGKHYLWLAKRDARGRFKSGDWVPYDSRLASAKTRRVMVIPDISPYRSTETGEVIGGRRQHREHLRDRGLIEIGNERLPERKVPLPNVREELKRAVEECR